MLDSFGKLLRNARARLDLTQAELARRVGVSGSYISQLEAGHKYPPQNELVSDLANALELSDRTLAEAAGFARVPQAPRRGENRTHCKHCVENDRENTAAFLRLLIQLDRVGWKSKGAIDALVREGRSYHSAETKRVAELHGQLRALYRLAVDELERIFGDVTYPAIPEWALPNKTYRALTGSR